MQPAEVMAGIDCMISINQFVQQVKDFMFLWNNFIKIKTERVVFYVFFAYNTSKYLEQRK